MVACNNVAFTHTTSIAAKYIPQQQRGDYRPIGAYAAMSMVQGGPGLPIFASAVLEYLSSGTVKQEYRLN